MADELPMIIARERDGGASARPGAERDAPPAARRPGRSCCER